MSNYKNFQLCQLGLKESQFAKRILAKEQFPGIDPEEQDGSIPSDREKMMSPTAVVSPVIAMAVRGSNTGGLPSGKKLTNTKLGGYTPIDNPKDNSEVVNKTPDNSTINSSSPISDGETTEETPHPHQVQKDADEPPQAVTGAGESEEDSELSLKSALPNAVEIDVDKECGDEEPSDEETPNEPMIDNQTEKHFDKVNDKRLEEVRKTLEEKALAGKMNVKETQVFSVLKEVIQKRKQIAESNKKFPWSGDFDKKETEKKSKKCTGGKNCKCGCND